MRAEGRDEDREQDQASGDPRIDAVRVAIELAVRNVSGHESGEQCDEHHHRHRVPEGPAEKAAPGLQTAALVVIACQLRRERGVGRLEEGDEGAREDGENDQIPEQRFIAPSRRRIPQEEIADRNRQRRRVHEWVTPAPSRTEIVRPVADNGVRDRVQHQRDCEREAHEPRINPDDLAVEDQQEEAEPLILDPERSRAEAIGELGAKCWSLRRGRRVFSHARRLGAGAPHQQPGAFTESDGIFRAGPSRRTSRSC
jgi:hypothetical protein